MKDFRETNRGEVFERLSQGTEVYACYFRFDEDGDAYINSLKLSDFSVSDCVEIIRSENAVFYIKKEVFE